MDRARARELAAEYVARGDHKGWFEQLYREAKEGKAGVPWADYRPNPNLIDFWERNTISAAGNTALVVGCGLGDDAEQLAAWGFHTVAFDISESAIRGCRERFSRSSVNYETADLFSAPREWAGAFDFVLESYTLQVLPERLRMRAMRCIATLVRDGGHLLVIARGREEEDPAGKMPWPLTHCELNTFRNCGLEEISFEDYYDCESPPVRRFRALYARIISTPPG